MDDIGGKMKIRVEPHNSEWKFEFRKALEFYRNLLSGMSVKIEHVGSTSVEGLWAKPILDIDLIVNSSKESKEVINKLAEVGYEHIGNYGVEGREAFRYSDNNTHINWMAHNLYVCLEGTENVVNHLMLRNHLRNNQYAVEAYSKVKRELAEKFPEDIDAYIDGKTELIVSFLRKEGMGKEALDRITDINKIEE